MDELKNLLSEIGIKEIIENDGITPIMAGCDQSGLFFSKAQIDSQENNESKTEDIA